MHKKTLILIIFLFIYCVPSTSGIYEIDLEFDDFLSGKNVCGLPGSHLPMDLLDGDDCIYYLDGDGSIHKCNATTFSCSDFYQPQVGVDELGYCGGPAQARIIYSDRYTSSGLFYLFRSFDLLNLPERTILLSLYNNATDNNLYYYQKPFSQIDGFLLQTHYPVVKNRNYVFTWNTTQLRCKINDWCPRRIGNLARCIYSNNETPDINMTNECFSTGYLKNYTNEDLFLLDDGSILVRNDSGFIFLDEYGNFSDYLENNNSISMSGGVSYLENFFFTKENSSGWFIGKASIVNDSSLEFKEIGLPIEYNYSLVKMSHYSSSFSSDSGNAFILFFKLFSSAYNGSGYVFCNETPVCGSFHNLSVDYPDALSSVLVSEAGVSLILEQSGYTFNQFTYLISLNHNESANITGTCFDGLLNQDEVVIDYGGVCGSCNNGTNPYEDSAWLVFVSTHPGEAFDPSYCEESTGVMGFLLIVMLFAILMIIIFVLGMLIFFGSYILFLACFIRGFRRKKNDKKEKHLKDNDNDFG